MYPKLYFAIWQCYVLLIKFALPSSSLAKEYGTMAHSLLFCFIVAGVTRSMTKHLVYRELKILGRCLIAPRIPRQIVQPLRHMGLFCLKKKMSINFVTFEHVGFNHLQANNPYTHVHAHGPNSTLTMGFEIYAHGEVGVWKNLKIFNDDGLALFSSSH
jgi:hypothetical protein